MGIRYFVLFLWGSVALMTSCSCDSTVGVTGAERVKRDNSKVGAEKETRWQNGLGALNDTARCEVGQKHGPIKSYLCRIIKHIKTHYKDAVGAMEKMQVDSIGVLNDTKQYEVGQEDGPTKSYLRRIMMHIKTHYNDAIGKMKKMQADFNALAADVNEFPDNVDPALRLETEAEFQKKQMTFFSERAAFHGRQAELYKNHSAFLRHIGANVNRTDTDPKAGLEMTRRKAAYYKAQLDLHRNEYRAHTKRVDFIANQTATDENQKDLLAQLKLYHNYMANYHGNEFEYHVNHFTHYDSKLPLQGDGTSALAENQTKGPKEELDES